MFVVYNEQGLNFRSTLEGLYRVEGITPVKQLKPLLTDNQEEAASGQSPLTGEAITAYKKVINAKNEETIYHAYQIMKRPVTAVAENMPIRECYDLLEKRKFRQAPVLGGDGTPIGIITKENLLKVILIDDETVRHSDDGTIAPLVSRPLISADPVSDIRRIAQVMYEYDLNSIPITNDADIIVGIITRADIIHAVSTHPAITLWA